MESSLNDPSFNTTHGSTNYDTAEDSSITSMYYSINDMESTLEARHMSQDISSMTLDDVGFPNQNITSQPVTTSNSSYINFNTMQQDAAMPDDGVNFLDQGLHEPNSSTQIIASSADEHPLMSEHSKQDHELGNKPILLGPVNQNQNIEDGVIDETESTHETMGQIVDTADGPMVLYKIPGSDELYAIPVDADQYEELMRESQNGSQIILTDESSCHMEQEKSLFSKPSNEEGTNAPLTACNIIEDNDISTDIVDKQSNNVYSTNVSVEKISYVSQDIDIQNATGIDTVPEISSKIKHVQCASDNDKIDSEHQVGNWQDCNEEYLDEEFLEYETTDGEPVTGDYDEKYHEVTNEKAQCEANVIQSAATFAQGTSLEENVICDPNLTHESDMQKTLNELHQKQSKFKMNRTGSSQIKGGQSLLNTNNVTFRTFRKMVPIGADYGLSNNTLKKITIKNNVVTKPVLNQSGVKVMPNLKPLHKECRNNASTKEIENVKNVHPQTSSSRDKSQKILLNHYIKPNVKTGGKNMTFLLISQPAANNQSHQQPKLTAVPLMSNESVLLKRNVQSSKVFNITKDGKIVICDSKGSVSNTVVSKDVESSEPSVQDKDRAPDLVKNKPRVRKQVLSTVNRDDLEITFEPVSAATVIETEKAKRSDVGKGRSIRKSIKLKLNNSSLGKVEVTQLSDGTNSVKETSSLEKNLQTKSTTGKKNQADELEDEDLKLPNVEPDMNSDESYTLENIQKPVKKSEKNEINIVDRIPDSDLKPSRFSNRLSNKPKLKKCRILSCNCDLEHHFNESVFQSDGYDSDDSQTLEKTIFSQDEDAPKTKQKRGKYRKHNSIDKVENNGLVTQEKGADMKIDNAELLCSLASTVSSCVKESDKNDTGQGSSATFNDGDILTKMQEIHKDVFADDTKESNLKEEDGFKGFIPDSELCVADLWVAFLCKVAKDDDEGNLKKSTVEIKTQGQEYVIDVTPAKPVLRSKIPKSNKLKRTVSVTVPPSKMRRLQHSTEMAKQSSDTPSKVDNIVVTTRMSMRQNPTQPPGPYICKHCFKQFAFESIFNNHITERCTKITDNERLKYITNLKQTGSKATKVSNKSSKVTSLTPKPTFKVPKLNSNIKAARLIPSKVISSRLLLGLHKSPSKQVQNSAIGLPGRRSTNHTVTNKESRMAQTKELHTRSFIRFKEKRRSKSTPDASVIKIKSPIKTKSAEKLRTNRRTLESESKKAVLRRSISAASVHQCSKCHEVYPTRAALFKHSNTHKDDPDLLKCSECYKIFKTKLARNAHLTLHAQKKIATKPLDLILDQTSASTNRRQTRQFPPGGKLKPRIAHGGVPLSTRMQKVFQRLKESTS